MFSSQTMDYASTEWTELDDVLDKYLTELDTWQQEVYNIRIAHHKIWKDSRVSEQIKQHRAGSRVESQTRILPPGKDTDVDYMFELQGVLVNCNDEYEDIYWKPSPYSLAFGTILVSNRHKEILQRAYEDIFTPDVFFWSQSENAFLLHPSKFKENVVKASHFDFKKDNKTSVTSPSISGRGAVNEYDTVPCLRLSRWPSFTLSWHLRGPELHGYAINSDWKRAVVDNVPLFLVPTGNPASPNKENEFRLSFSMVEIKCFDKLTPRMRKSYGIAKYVFKKIFASEICDLLSSYHIKTIFMQLVEEISIDNWEKIPPTKFIEILFSSVRSCILLQNITHYFIKGCNIFPVHKTSGSNIEYYQKNFRNDTKIITETVLELLRNDLHIPAINCQDALKIAREKINYLTTSNRMKGYVDGYLTRLLSMTTFSLFENFKKANLTDAVENVRAVFEFYKADKNLQKIINTINVFLVSVYTRNTELVCLIPSLMVKSMTGNVSEIAHAAFELYLVEGYSDVQVLLSKCSSEFTPNEIGVSVTKFHKNYVLDIPLHFVINELEKRYGFCPRFYIDPFLMLMHLKIQIYLRQRCDEVSKDYVRENLMNMETTINQLSIREPYMGKLSYKFAAVFLIHGYKKQFRLLGLNIALKIPEALGMDSFNQRMFATNFDLR